MTSFETSRQPTLLGVWPQHLVASARLVTYVSFVTVPRDGSAVRYQVHALEPWVDPLTGEVMAYLAGFRSPEARAEYCAQQGYIEVPSK
jgi:hypothetical protein